MDDLKLKIALTPNLALSLINQQNVRYQNTCLLTEQLCSFKQSYSGVCCFLFSIIRKWGEINLFFPDGYYISTSNTY